jgi:hypothetical protein
VKGDGEQQSCWDSNDDAEQDSGYRGGFTSSLAGTDASTPCPDRSTMGVAFDEVRSGRDLRSLISRKIHRSFTLISCTNRSNDGILLDARGGLACEREVLIKS